jgi:hypothetical protein
VAALAPAEREAAKPTNMPASAELALPKPGEANPAAAAIAPTAGRAESVKALNLREGGGAIHGRGRAALVKSAKLLTNPWRAHAK